MLAKNSSGQSSSGPMPELSRHPSKTLSDRSLSNRSLSKTLSDRSPSRSLTNRSPSRSLSNRSPSRSLSNRSPSRSLSDQTPSRSLSNRSPDLNPAVLKYAVTEEDKIKIQDRVLNYLRQNGESSLGLKLIELGQILNVPLTKRTLPSFRVAIRQYKEEVVPRTIVPRTIVPRAMNECKSGERDPVTKKCVRRNPCANNAPRDPVTNRCPTTKKSPKKPRVVECKSGERDPVTNKCVRRNPCANNAPRDPVTKLCPKKGSRKKSSSDSSSDSSNYSSSDSFISHESGSDLSPYRDGVRVPDEEIDQLDPGRDPTIVWKDRNGRVRNFLEEQNKVSLKRDELKKEADLVEKRMNYVKKFTLASTKKKEAAKKEEGDESFDAPDIVRPEKWTSHHNNTGELLLSNKDKYACVLVAPAPAAPEPAAPAAPDPVALFKPVEKFDAIVTRYHKQFTADYKAYAKGKIGATRNDYIPIWEAQNPGLKAVL